MILRNQNFYLPMSSVVHHVVLSETRCAQDEHSPTVPPTPPHPSPTLAPESPAVHKYNVSGANGTCLLAKMGLQLNITYEKKDSTVGSVPRSASSCVGVWCVSTGIYCARCLLECEARTLAGAYVCRKLIGTQPGSPRPCCSCFL